MNRISKINLINTTNLPGTATANTVLCGTVLGELQSYTDKWTMAMDWLGLIFVGSIFLVLMFHSIT